MLALASGRDLICSLTYSLLQGASQSMELLQISQIVILTLSYHPLTVGLLACSPQSRILEPELRIWGLTLRFTSCVTVIESNDPKSLNRNAEWAKESQTQTVQGIPFFSPEAWTAR